MPRIRRYGLGGALLTVGKNLSEGKGFGSGALQGVGKAAVTPGSAIGAGADLAGNLLQKTNNPALQGIGKGLNVASNFAPGGGGVAGAVGDIAGIVNQGAAAGAGGGAGAGNLLQQGAQLLGNVASAENGVAIPHNPELAGAPYKMRGVSLMKFENGGKPGEVPGFDMTTRQTMRAFDVESQKPVMDETRQIYIDGLPVSARQAKAFMDERAEGMEGQVSSSLGDAMEAATARRVRERHGGREYLGPGMYRPRAVEELQAAQKRQGVSGLLGALEGYDTSLGTRNYGKGGYLR